MRIKFLGFLSALLLLAIAHPAFADGIINVSGSVDYGPGSGAVRFAGDRGFTFNGSANIPETVLDPKHCIGVPTACAPGTTISLDANANGSDVPGQATLEGTTFPTGCSNILFCGGSISLEFIGQVIAPPFGQSTTATVTGPVGFFGLFFHIDDLSQGLVREQLVAGAATASLTLEQNNFLGSPAWHFKEVRYDLASTPEPTAVLLWGTAAVGVALAGWRGRRRASSAA